MKQLVQALVNQADVAEFLSVLFANLENDLRADRDRFLDRIRQVIRLILQCAEHTHQVAVMSAEKRKPAVFVLKLFIQFPDQAMRNVHSNRMGRKLCPDPLILGLGNLHPLILGQFMAESCRVRILHLIVLQHQRIADGIRIFHGSCKYRLFPDFKGYCGIPSLQRLKVAVLDSGRVLHIKDIHQKVIGFLQASVRAFLPLLQRHFPDLFPGLLFERIIHEGKPCRKDRIPELTHLTMGLHGDLRHRKHA